MLDNWQRIEKVVNWTGLSVNAFARNIGLKRAENLYQIKKGNHGISKELAEMITAKYSTVNKSWLLTGQGEMFLDDARDMNSNIPYYKVDVVRLLSSREFFTPGSFLALPFFPTGELAALHIGNAMEPDLPSGSIVILHKIEPQKIMPGKQYLVMSLNFNGIRTLRRDPASTQIRLVPRNRQDYDEVIIETEEITGLHEVLGYIMPWY